jgi:hypothetical protein
VGEAQLLHQLAPVLQWLQHLRQQQMKNDTGTVHLQYQYFCVRSKFFSRTPAAVQAILAKPAAKAQTCLT